MTVPTPLPPPPTVPSFPARDHRRAKASRTVLIAVGSAAIGAAVVVGALVAFRSPATSADVAPAATDGSIATTPNATEPPATTEPPPTSEPPSTTSAPTTAAPQPATWIDEFGNTLTTAESSEAGTAVVDPHGHHLPVHVDAVGDAYYVNDDGVNVYLDPADEPMAQYESVNMYGDDDGDTIPNGWDPDDTTFNWMTMVPNDELTLVEWHSEGPDVYALYFPGGDSMSRVTPDDFEHRVSTWSFDSDGIDGESLIADADGDGVPDAADPDSAPAASSSASLLYRDELPLRLCDQGMGVGYMQEALSNRGYEVAADQEFGPATEAAVRAFQRDNGLVADGIVGPATWRALGGGAGPAWLGSQRRRHDHAGRAVRTLK